MSDRARPDATRSSRRPAALGLALLFAVVLASRVPFLAPGYGLDGDGWAVVRSAHVLRTTGEYAVSRLPGYPVPEIGYALLGPPSPWLYNGATAVLSAVAVVAFASVLAGYRASAWFLAGVGFACVPVFFVNSTTSMDYVWALAGGLSALAFVRRGWLVAAGVAAGLAIGGRLTWGAFLLPLVLVVEPPLTPRRLARLLVPALAVSALAFAPIVARYGPGFLRFFETEGDVPPTTVVRAATSNVWGAVGLAGFAAAAVVTLVERRRTERRAVTGPVPNRHVIAWVLAIAVYGAAFLRLPHDPGYLLPVVPFVLLVAARIATPLAFRVLCVGLVASAFVDWSPATGTLAHGTVVRRHRMRQALEETYAETLLETDRLPEDRVALFTGPLCAKLHVTRLLATEPRRRDADHEVFLRRVTPAILRSLRDEGFALYTLSTTPAGQGPRVLPVPEVGGTPGTADADG